MTCEMFSCAFGSYARVRSSYAQKINPNAKKQTYTKNNKPFLKKNSPGSTTSMSHASVSRVPFTTYNI